MRVIHVSPYFAPAFCYGGPPRSILGLCQGLTHAGVDVEVFTTTANGADQLPADPDGHDYDGVRARYFPLGFPRRYWRSPGLERAVSEAARHADFVHVHGLWNFTGWSGVRAARAAGVPYAISPRGMLQGPARARHRALKDVAFAAIERANLRGAAFLHATSAEEAGGLGDFGPPVVLVANGVTPEDATPADMARVRREADIPDAAPVVLFLGRLHPIKRLDLLADAFLRVRRTMPDAYLVLAGPDEGGHRRLVEAQLQSAADRVRFVGPVVGADKAAWLASSAVLVQCSDSESFGMSVAEALAAGTPAVVTDRGSWRDLEASGCGLVVAHSADALAAALERMLRNPAEASAMGARGRAWVAGRLGWDEVGREMARAYETALARTGAAA